MPPTTASTSTAPAVSTDAPLTPRERRAYSRAAQTMEYYHNHFRATWNLLYSACTANTLPPPTSTAQFLTTAAQFLQHLALHHSIEEQHIFPVLARRMPAFQKGGEGGHLLVQHRQIHEGMDELERFVTGCQSGERAFQLSEMKGVMDGFGSVLWAHLEDEVSSLGAEEMKRFWTLEEVKKLPM